MACNFIPKRNYSVTVEVGGDYFDDCGCNTIRSVFNYLDRTINRILLDSRESIILPTINITIKDWKSL